MAHAICLPSDEEEVFGVPFRSLRLPIVLRVSKDGAEEDSEVVLEKRPVEYNAVPIAATPIPAARV